MDPKKLVDPEVDPKSGSQEISGSLQELQSGSSRVDPQSGSPKVDPGASGSPKVDPEK